MPRAPEPARSLIEYHSSGPTANPTLSAHRLKISGIVSRDILTACEGLQIDIRPEALRFDPNRQRPKKSQVFGNLLLGDSLTLTVRDENVVGDFKCPDFRGDGVVRYQFLENLSLIHISEPTRLGMISY